MSEKHTTLKKWLTVNAALLLLSILTVVFALNTGSSGAGILNALKDKAALDIILISRLPRIVLGMIAGMALGSGGVAFQALLRNPLADPYILGVSGGAALGSAVGVAANLGFTTAVFCSLVASLVTMFFIYAASGKSAHRNNHTLLLTGVIFNAFAFALIMLIHTMVTMEQAHEILFMLIGSLETTSWKEIALVGTMALAGFAILFAVAPKMNALSLGEETSKTLGIEPANVRKIIFFAASIMIGAVVSLTGLIGFVGLFIPHAARLLFGSDHRITLPAGALLGGSFMVLADTLARTVLSGGNYQTQLPVGVITALIGGPVFFLLLRKNLSPKAKGGAK